MSRSAREVLSETDQIVSQDRKLTLRLLVNLHDIEHNKFYLELGYGSMFDYCTQHLKWSEGSAVRRIRSARCLAEYPQLGSLLGSGDVNTCTVAAIAKHIKPDNAHAVIEAIRNKSAREVARFVASLNPLSVLPPARVRPFVVAVPHCAKSTINVGGNESSTVEEVSALAAEPPTLPPTGAQHEVVHEYKRMLHVELNMPEERMHKLDRIRALASHRLRSNASLDDVIDFMADYFLKREDPIQRQQRREERASSTKAPAAASDHPRHVPADVRDQVHVRDQRCTYVGPDGKRCNSTHVLQVDHIRPVARRGAAVIENLRLLCAEHNRLESERLMGKRHVIRESRARYAAS